MNTPCNTPLPLAELVDYLAGELDPDDEGRIEEHVFECASCTRRLEQIAAIGDGVRQLVRAGQIGVAVTDALVARAERDGLQMRQYRLAPGETVQCTASPDDDFLVVRLTGAFGRDADVALEVDFEDRQSGGQTRLPPRLVSVDREREQEEIVLLFPGEEVREYPRSLWTIHVRSRTPDEGETVLGPYHMDHTPWAERRPH